jgi:hypothetical protein
VVDNIWDPNWRLIGFFALHVGLLTLLLTFSLFAWDRFRVPTPLVICAAAICMAVPLIWPIYQPVGWDDLPNVVDSSRLRIALGLIAGGLAGLILGNCLVRRRPGNIRAGDVFPTLVGMSLVGLCLGWQAALVIAALTVFARLLFAFTPARSWPMVTSITLATLVHLLVWRWLSQLPCYPGLHGHLLFTAGLVLVVPIAAMLVDGLERGGDAGPTIVDRPAFPLPVEAPLATPEELQVAASDAEPSVDA